MAAESRPMPSDRRTSSVPRLVLLLAAATAGLLLVGCSGHSESSDATESAFSVSTLERRAFNYFRDQADPKTGLVADRAINVGPLQPCGYSSVAATGFGLVAFCAGVERGWISHDAAYAQVRKTLRFLWSLKGDDCPHGFYYHWVNPATGKRSDPNSEVSSIDTAWLLAGALFAGQYFKGTEVETLARRIYERTDFPWLLGRGTGDCANPLILCHGWTPETGFIPSCWNAYSEHMVLYLLAIGSPTHPIPPGSWKAWRRTQANYKKWRTFVDLPLFAHQFSHCFVDFRNKHDLLGYDYWQSSVNATIINAQFCRDQTTAYATYRNGIWGLSACDGPSGYRAYRAPPITAIQDGTVAPWAVCGSLVFDKDIAQTGYATDLCRTTLGKIYTKYGSQIWGRYGFSDGLNVDQNWYDTQIVGIDAGCGLMMIENADHHGFVWKYFMALDCIQRAFACGFYPCPPG